MNGRGGRGRVIGSGIRATVLAAHTSRSRVTRERDGTIHLCWQALGVRMTQGEFVDLIGLVSGAAEGQVRCGELARCPCGRVSRCSMGQIVLSHSSFTLWFSPEEFDGFCRLVAEARRRLADTEPLPPLGLPWAPQRESFSPN